MDLYGRGWFELQARRIILQHDDHLEHILLPGLKGAETDSLVVLVVAKHFPMLAAIVTAAAVAAGMSTLDSQLLSASSLVTRDFYVRYCKPDASPQQEARVGQLAVLVLSVIIYVFALTWPGLIVPLATAGAGICVAGYLGPTIGALFWPRVGKDAAFWSMVAGGLAAALTFVPWQHPFGIHNTVWGVIAGLVVLFVLSPVTKPLPYPQQERFHALFEKVIYDD
ncbi:MAG: hypothetical protein AB1609_11175 [Bacillota bacterium]